MKKAISAATSAALLASLLATAVAPSTFAAITVANVGSIAQGATSATEATFTFTENSIAALTTTGSFTVTITPAAPGVGTVTFVGTPTLTGNVASLGATIAAGPSSFTITVTGHDDLNIETLVVGGLKIKASADASPGAIVATLSGNAAVYGAFQGGNYTATGKLAQAYGIGTTAWLVAVDATSLCDFAGTNNVTVGGEVRTVTSVAAKTPAGQQAFVTNAFAVNHLANDVVTQTVPVGGPGTSCSLTTVASPGTVATALTYAVPTQPTVFAGETNAPAGNLTIFENASTGAAYFVAGKTITATITTAGVKFSHAPRATASNLGFLFTATPTPSNPAVASLSADGLTATWTIDTASALTDTITISDINYDVASTVVGGTAVNVTIAYSGGNVQPTSRSNAIVGRPVTASSTSATVYIGENNQTAGTISIVENAAGTFTDGTGSYNTFEFCLTTGETVASAPSATVSVGNLQLRSGAVAAAAGTAVVGTPFTSGTGNPNCYYWTVWAASTTASTVTIGPLMLNVPAGLAIGPTNAAVGIGSVALFDVTTAIQLKVADRVFRNQVVVTALSQPTIPVGSNGSAVGDIQVQETANGQLKAGEEICVEILPNQNVNILYDAFLKGLNTADRPIATGSNGVVVGAVALGQPGELCTRNIPAGGIGSTLVLSFSVVVSQQSTTANGKIVFSNIKYATVNDAVTGPVQVNVYGLGASNTQVQFQSLISNAKIGAVSAISIGAVSALGLKPTTGYTTKTPKYQVVRKYVTWKFTGGQSLAGQRVNVMVAKKVNGAWGGPKYLKSAIADANGIVTFAWKFNSAAAINVRVQWPGNTSFAVSWSKALGAYWK